MSLKARIDTAQARIGDFLLWIEAQRIAEETGESPETVYEQGRRLAEKYAHLEVHLPGGRVDIEAVLKAMARDEGFDYELLSAEAHRVVRDMEREISRRKNRARKRRE